jgi:hypothetical protein
MLPNQKSRSLNSYLQKSMVLLHLAYYTDSGELGSMEGPGGAVQLVLGLLENIAGFREGEDIGSSVETEEPAVGDAGEQCSRVVIEGGEEEVPVARGGGDAA